MKNFKKDYSEDEKVSVAVALLSSMDFFPGDSVLTVCRQVGMMEDVFFRTLGCFVDMAGKPDKKRSPDFSGSARVRYLQTPFEEVVGGSYDKVVVFDMLNELLQKKSLAKVSSHLEEGGRLVVIETMDFDFDLDEVKNTFPELNFETEFFNGEFFVLSGVSRAKSC